MDVSWWSDVLKQFLITVAGSSVGMGLLKLFYDHTKEKGNRRERARHLALLVAQHLESFVIPFTYRLADDHEHWNSSGHAGTSLSEHPKIGPPPASTDYQLLDSALVDRLYALPVDCDEASNAILGSLEYVDPEDETHAMTVRHLHMARLLKRIFVLASDIRKHYGLGIRPGTERRGWDREGWLDDHIEWIDKEYDKQSEEQAERNRLLVEGMKFPGS